MRISHGKTWTHSHIIVHLYFPPLGIIVQNICLQASMQKKTAVAWRPQIMATKTNKTNTLFQFNPLCRLVARPSGWQPAHSFFWEHDFVTKRFSDLWSSHLYFTILSLIYSQVHQQYCKTDCLWLGNVLCDFSFLGQSKMVLNQVDTYHCPLGPRCLSHMSGTPGAKSPSHGWNAAVLWEPQIKKTTTPNRATWIKVAGENLFQKFCCRHDLPTALGIGKCDCSAPAFHSLLGVVCFFREIAFRYPPGSRERFMFCLTMSCLCQIQSHTWNTAIIQRDRNLGELTASYHRIPKPVMHLHTHTIHTMIDSHKPSIHKKKPLIWKTFN